MSIFTYGERSTNCWMFTVSHMKHPTECLINILLLHLLGCHTIPMLFMRKQPLRILITYLRFSSVQFSCSVVSDSLWPHEPQHARPLCPSPTPGVHPNPCPLSRWYHPTISSSVVPFSSCPQSQHQGLLKCVSSSHQVAKVLEFQLQHQSFQWTPRTVL